jgi:predicted restriction endonuclease
VRELLVASHIVPWAEDESNRLNPKNGLCLNALHDRAFDRHLMWVDGDLSIHFSPRLRESAREDGESLRWLLRYEGARLQISGGFEPDARLLGQHASQCQVG